MPSLHRAFLKLGTWIQTHVTSLTGYHTKLLFFYMLCFVQVETARENEQENVFLTMLSHSMCIINTWA